MKKIFELKKELKELAQEIRETKDYARGNKAREAGRGAGYYQCALLFLKRDFRHKHIAYCLMRGKTYEQIEKPRKGNETDQTLIKEIRDAYAKPAQDVCTCSS
jgi:uncharacterized protein YcsI (UPF0317 family)